MDSERKRRILSKLIGERVEIATFSEGDMLYVNKIATLVDVGQKAWLSEDGASPRPVELSEIGSVEINMFVRASERPSASALGE